MIDKIQIESFQSHKWTEFDLPKGVTVITGSSDSGKSSIIRGLKWLFQNKPQGDSFRNNNTKDKNPVSVTAVFDDGSYAIREKSKKGNYYFLDTDDPLQALRTDVPDEVQDVTRMKAVNIQSQHPNDQYFLLTDSPGQVAKQFNEVAGFEIMDKALAKVNSVVRETDSELKFITAEIETGTGKVKEMEWIPEALTKVKKLKILETEIEEEENALEELDSLCLDIDKVKEKLKEFKFLSEAEEGLQSLVEIRKEINQEKQGKEILSNLCQALKSLDTELIDTLPLEKAITSLNSLISLFNLIETLKTDTEDLEITLEDMQINQKRLFSIEEEVKDYQDEFNTFLEEECPTCGRGGI